MRHRFSFGHLLGYPKEEDRRTYAIAWGAALVTFALGVLYVIVEWIRTGQAP